MPHEVNSKMASKSARAKRAEKASCGETVVQKGIFGESVSSLPPSGLLLKHLKALRGQRRNGLSKNTLLDDCFSAPRLLCSFRQETKGWFCTLVPVFGAGEHLNVPSLRVLVLVGTSECTLVPVLVQGTSAKTTLLETTLL